LGPAPSASQTAALAPGCDHTDGPLEPYITY
jgi:hypothetical protein